MFKISLKKVFLLIMIFLPFADALNGYMIQKKGVYGVGSGYHSILTVLLIFFLLKRTGKEGNIFKRNFFIAIFSITLSILINILYYEPLTSISIERILKILINFLNLAAFSYLLDPKRTNREEAKKIFYYQSVVIISITFISDVTGICNYAHWNNRGRMGLFSGTNEPVVIILIIMGFMLWMMCERSKFRDSLLFIMSEICLIFTESKAGFIMAIVYFLLFMYVLYTRSFKRKTLKNILLILIGTMAMTVGITISYKYVSESFLGRQKKLMIAYAEAGLIAYFTSGRSLRISRLLFGHIGDGFSSGNVIDPIVSVFKIFFGNGAWYSFNDTVEMDFFDIAMYGGIIWSFVYLINTICIVKKVFKFHKDLVSKIVITTLVISSFFIGHVWTGGYCGVYYTMFCVFLMNYLPAYYSTEKTDKVFLYDR